MGRFKAVIFFPFQSTIWGNLKENCENIFYPFAIWSNLKDDGENIYYPFAIWSNLKDNGENIYIIHLQK